MCIACGANHQLANGNKITPEDLAACGWVLPSQESLSRRALEDAFLLCGRTAPTPLIEVSSFVYGLAMAAHSDLLTVAPRTAVHAQEKLGLVRTLKTSLQLKPTAIYWMRRRSSDGDTVLDGLEQWLLRNHRKTGAGLTMPRARHLKSAPSGRRLMSVSPPHRGSRSDHRKRKSPDCSGL